MRTYLNSTYLNSLPSDLSSIIIDTNVISGHGSSQSTNFSSTDKLYLLSTKEIFGKNGQSYTYTDDSADDKIRQLDYYQNNNVTTDSNYTFAIKKTYGSVDYNYWTLSAVLNKSNRFCVVCAQWYGGCVSYADAGRGVAPAFRIG